MLPGEHGISIDDCFSWTAAKLNRVIMNSSSADRMYDEEKEYVFYERNKLTLSFAGQKS